MLLGFLILVAHTLAATDLIGLPLCGAVLCWSLSCLSGVVLCAEFQKEGHAISALRVDGASAAAAYEQRSNAAFQTAVAIAELFSPLARCKVINLPWGVAAHRSIRLVAASSVLYIRAG